MGFVSGREFIRAATGLKNDLGFKPLHRAPSHRPNRLEVLYQGANSFAPNPAPPIFRETKSAAQPRAICIQTSRRNRQ